MLNEAEANTFQPALESIRRRREQRARDRQVKATKEQTKILKKGLGKKRGK